MVAAGLALAAVMGIAFVTYSFAALRRSLPGSVRSGVLPALDPRVGICRDALTAAVVEEATFRGYILSGIQRRFGWAAGIGLVTVLSTSLT